MSFKINNSRFNTAAVVLNSMIRGQGSNNANNQNTSGIPFATNNNFINMTASGGGFDAARAPEVLANAQPFRLNPEQTMARLSDILNGRGGSSGSGGSSPT